MSEESTKSEQTERRIPEGWEVKRIGDIGKVTTGRTPSTKEEKYWGQGYPFVTPSDIVDFDVRYNYDVERKLTEEWLEVAKDYFLPKDAVCFVCIGSTIGKMCLLKDPSFTNQQINSVTVNEDNDSMFTFYLFKKNQKDIRSIYGGGGAAKDIISKSTFEKIDLILPARKEEQIGIAKVLSSLDSKIEKNQQMNKTLEAIGRAVFKRWFVDFEFPNEEGKPYKSSGGEMVCNEELDKEIPEGWRAKPIDEIADFLNGLALQKFPARDGEESLPVIKIRELRQGITESSNKANLDLPEDYIVNNGDVLFSWSGSLEVVIWGFGKGALNQHLFKVTSSKYPKWFFYYWILHYLPEYRQIAADKATTMGHIQRHHLTASQVIVPDDKTLERMDKLLAPILERISGIKVETKVLSEIRDLLLPKLMSGKIRVPAPKDNVEPD